MGEEEGELLGGGRERSVGRRYEKVRTLETRKLPSSSILVFFFFFLKTKNDLPSSSLFLGFFLSTALPDFTLPSQSPLKSPTIDPSSPSNSDLFSSSFSKSSQSLLSSCLSTFSAPHPGAHLPYSLPLHGPFKLVSSTSLLHPHNQEKTLLTDIMRIQTGGCRTLNPGSTVFEDKRRHSIRSMSHLRADAREVIKNVGISLYLLSVFSC